MPESEFRGHRHVLSRYPKGILDINVKKTLPCHRHPEQNKALFYWLVFSKVFYFHPEPWGNDPF